MCYCCVSRNRRSFCVFITYPPLAVYLAWPKEAWWLLLFLLLTCRPSLKHQRPQEEKQKQYSALNEWYKRGVIEGKTSTKFRKGACENCGSMTHKKKDCMEVGWICGQCLLVKADLFVSAVQVLKYPIFLISPIISYVLACKAVLPCYGGQ